MRRSVKRAGWLLLGLAALAVAIACQQQAVSPSASLAGIRDMVRIGDFIIATSTENNELRVLQLETGSTLLRRYVRAPNPIQALSIPVLNRPTSLVTDTYYPYDGGTTPTGESYGPYVYASSPGTAEISIVWGENGLPDGGPDGFVELARLSTIAPVTAMAALGGAPDSMGRPQSDTFYFATFDGTTATLFSLIPGPPEMIASQDLQSLVKPIFTRTGVSIVDMIPLPNHQLALALRSATGKTGSAEIYDAQARTSVRPLQFPGPVRQLHTHGAYCPVLMRDALAIPPTCAVGTAMMPPASRIFGVIDEDACGGSSCGGIIAVETSTGERSLSAPGAALPATVPIEQRNALPISFGGGLVQSVSFAPAMNVVSQTDLMTPVLYPLVGVVTLSNGMIGFFDAESLTPIMSNLTGPFATINIPDGGIASSTDAGPGTGYPVVQLSVGAVHDDTLVAVGNGVIQDLGGLTIDPDAGQRLPTPFAARAEVGDLVVPATTTDGQTLGVCDGGVTAVEADGVRFDGQCSGTLSVRAAGAHPYVVVSTATGYIGRSGPGQTLTYPGTYFSQLPGYDPRVPAISITFPDQPVLALEERFTLTIVSNYLPLQFQLTSTACSAGTTTLPGTVIADVELRSPGDSPLGLPPQRLFVAYPSANGIMEIDPMLVHRSFSLDTGITCWR